jgi:thermitase
MGRSPGWRTREMIRLAEAHAFTKGRDDVIVAVLDTGVDLEHPEYKDVLLPGFDWVDIIDGADEFIGDFLGADPIPDDEVGHGTHVTGIIAGAGHRMPAGVCPRCRIVPVRVLAAMESDGQRYGAGAVGNISAGIKWAADYELPVDIINMSLGVQHAGGGLPHEEVIAYAQSRGITIVAAAGNDGKETLYYPGAFDYVVTVGAVDEDGAVSSYSTYGRQVDLVAPGTDVFSTHLNGKYAFSTGTSHAAPFVAGAAALLKSFARERGRRLSDRQLKHIFHHTCDKPGRSFKDTHAGFGMLNLADAMRLLDHRLN